MNPTRKRSREEMLGVIRRSLGRDGMASELASGDTVPRPGEAKVGDPGREGEEHVDLRLARLVERLEDYEVLVLRGRPDGLSGMVESRVKASGIGSLVLPPGLPSSWLPGGGLGKVEILQEDVGSPIPKDRLARADGVLTGCAMAIAETGTLVLDAGETQGRRALSLLPDYHLCVVFAHQVTDTVHNAIRALADQEDGPARPLTLISGPSATSDIELIRVKGVHGPRTVDVILLEDLSG